ncbi:MAG TPA: hypothetical protein PLI90_07095 [Rhodocyclaceae bacterium]|nr:hypothetical protein [Rhodocyclaceae bacterium]
MLPGARNHGTRLIRHFGPAALFIIVTTLLSQSTPSSRWLRQDAAAPFLHVAHALGAIDSAVYTNSAEAFHSNYAAGFRHFEVDLMELKDGNLVAFHNLVDTHEFGSIAHISSFTLGEFLRQRYYQRYTPLSASGVLQLLQRHDDAYLIVDAKNSSLRRQTDDELPDLNGPRRVYTALSSLVSQHSPKLAGRIIPQVYSLDDLEWIGPLGFSEQVIWTQYREPVTVENLILALRRHPQIRWVAMKPSQICCDIAARIAPYGVSLLAFTINESAEMRRLNELGVRGIYTDFLRPSATRGRPQ